MGPCIFSIGIDRRGIPRFSARSTASDTEPSEEYRDGSDTPVTFSGPSASTAIAATRAESIPPDNATNTFSNPLFSM